MGPINYDLPDPNEALINGLKIGTGIQQIQQQADQAQLARQAALQQQMDLQRLASNPNATHQDYAAVMTKYPALAEHLGKAYTTLTDGQKQNALNFGTRVYAAQQAGNTDLAVQLLKDRAKADPTEAQHWNTLADLTQHAPAAAKTVTALTLSSLMGPDKFATAFSTLGQEQRAEEQAPADLRTKNANATTAEATAGIKRVEAANAPTDIALKNETARQGILSAEAQRKVADFNAQIAAANSETQRGQLVLERDKFIAEQGNKNQAAGQDLQNQFDGITQGLDTVKSLKADLDNWTKLNGVGSSLGKVAAYIPGTDAMDFRAKLGTLKAQQFLAQAQKMKGLGALTEIEGAKIEKAVAALDPDMSEAAFRTALNTIETTLTKGHAKLIAMGKLPKDGGAFVLKHPVYGNVGDGDIQRLMTQNPGTTREQVIQFLKSTGGQ